MKTRLRLPLFTLLMTLLCLGMSSQGWGQTTVSYNFSDPGAVSGLNANPPIALDSNIGFASFKNDGTSNPGIFSGQLRLYQNPTKGGSIKVYAQNGVIITSVIVYASGTTGPAEYTVDGGTAISLTISGGSYSMNSINGITEVEFYCVGNSTGTRIYIDSFEVTYEIGTSDPILNTTLSAISNLDYTESNGPSASQSFELSGANLDGTDVDVVLPALSDFEISADDTDFFDSLNFPAFDGTATTLYVRLKAGLAINTYTDNITISGGGADPVSVSLSGEVQPEPVLGWQITAANTDFVIDFDTTVNGVNEGQYAGSGFETAPATGRLNSNAFAATGMSDGTLNFGDTQTTGDFAGGTSTGGETGGGFYAFEVAPGNRAFGWQATGSDFAPGSMTLRLQNQTGTTIETMRLTYTVYVYNDQGRSNNVNLSYSDDNITFTQQPLLEVVSEETAAITPEWTATTYTVLIGLENIPDGDFYYLRWDTADVAGSGSRDEFAIDDITLTANPDNLVFIDSGSFTFPIYHGTFTLEPGDDLLVLNSSFDFTFGDVEFGNITINPGASISLNVNLKINGDLINNGSFIFFSFTTFAGQLDAVPATSSVLGDMIIERYISARRAFRLLSSAVTTTGTIKDNWQEGVNNPDIATNLNPSPAFGTHITGSQTGQNGFDATPSGNPSLFTLNNTAQAWEAVTNTDVNTITAGRPYRLFVRGDRSIDVTDNSAEPTATRLRTTGTLHTGPYTFTDFSEVEEDFNFFGNPYPAAVDMNAVLALPANNNINPNRYYIWDLNLNTRGKYVVIDLPAGSNSDGSAGNLYLQPGQAAFVTTLANGPASLTFEEAHKNVAAPNTAVFSTDNRMDLRLYEAGSFADNGPVADGLRIKFAEGNTNALTSLDAPKFYNLDENLASSNDDRLWSIESRALPLEGESIPLFTNQYRHTDYVFEIELTELTGVTAVLRDHFTGTDTELAVNDTSLYAFNVDPADPASIADDRFEIVFEELLSTNDVRFGNNFVLFPNPAQGEINLATKGISGDDVSVSITSITGQKVYSQAHTVSSNGQLAIDAAAFAPGVYILKLTHNGGQFTTKFIKK
tara:strand:- start:538 stop:3792 length:3255 start_codon:yes stop_codon:yes gene_type:complete